MGAAGALAFVAAATVAPAQQDTTRAPRDTVRRQGPPGRDTLVVPVPQRPDSSIVADTTAEAVARRDTLKAPFARAESPPSTDIGFRYTWDRTEYYASGALTLADLLERVPGLTTFRGGWIAAPATASYLGAMGRVRVYMDGIEYDALAPREGGMNDLGAIQLWQLEDVTVERGASEVRVFVRTLRHDRTTPNTRVDVFTGDEDTNAYRGFYGKRWRNGMGLQVGAQQWSTSASPLEGGSGDALSLLLRVGWARGSWSIDGFAQQNRRNYDQLRDGTIGGTDGGVIPGSEVRDRLVYLRAGWRRPDLDGPWLQLTASARRVTEAGERITTAGGTFPVDTIDTLAVRPQYVAAAGYTRGGFRLSGTLRARGGTGSGDALLSPGVRVSVDRRWLSATAFAERVERFDDSTITRVEALARLSPTSWFSIGGAVSREDGNQSLAGEGVTDPVGGGTVEPSITPTVRGEAALRLRRVWVSGGVMRRGDAVLRTPRIFYPQETIPADVNDAPLNGTFAAIRGPIWKAIGVDAWGVRWERGDGLYRPQYQSRSELYVRSNLLRRFPSGEFGVLFAATHEYRSNALFLAPGGTGLRTAPQSRVIGTLLELRLQNAVISWQFRNIAGERYAWVPGLVAPRPVNVYGVRWEFWN